MEKHVERTMIQDISQKIGETVKIQGWAKTVRDHGKITFVDLRDRSGVVQCIISKRSEKIFPESVVEIHGVVQKRPAGAENKHIDTGDVEIDVTAYVILNTCVELPIPLDGDGYDVSEDMRMKYRYLDLRRERMQKMLMLRSSVMQSWRRSLLEKDFVEVETPLLTKGTTEGSRNFIVPSRMYPGKFYALPQSPQQYKQLLMTAGIERYFQFARCIRDEDPKSDRVFEFTQFDVEMSFVTSNDVMRVLEDVLVSSIRSVGGIIKDVPFPVIDYDEAMKKYGSDKFDLRSEKEKEDGVLSFAWVVNFPFFKKVNKGDALEVEDSRSGWVFTHNPFSKPIDEHITWHCNGKNIDKIRTDQYDLVCNGYEVGGGSIRAHVPEILRATYQIMGYSDEEIDETIGHMLEAFSLGTPPHGGIALGFDRIIMQLTGDESMSEIVAFPTSGRGRTSVTDAPTDVSPQLLKELGICVETGEHDRVYDEILRLLVAEGFDYEVLEHKAVKTSEEAARERGTKQGDAPKAMILKTQSGGFVMVCVPADRDIAIERVERVVGEPVRMAPPEEVAEKFGISVGAIPPIGSLFSIPTYFDKELWKKDTVVFNAGRRDRSIRMKAQDLLVIARPENVSKTLDFKR